MKRLMIAILFFVPLTSHAKTLFYCKTTKGKKVKVTQTGKTVRYVFGKNLNNPELAIKQPVSKVNFDTEMYSGGSAGIISIPNGKYSYQLRQADLAGEYQPDGTRARHIAGSITVLKYDNEIADLDCIGKTVKGMWQ